MSVRVSDASVQEYKTRSGDQMNPARDGDEGISDIQFGRLGSANYILREKRVGYSQENRGVKLGIFYVHCHRCIEPVL